MADQGLIKWDFMHETWFRDVEIPFRFVLYPPLGVGVIWEFQEFQEFQELKATQRNFKKQKRVAKIKRQKMVDRRAFILFRT